MNIGFVTTWFERGAAYVTKAYVDAIAPYHNTFIYARGGEKYAKDDAKWNKENVTWGLNLHGDKISFPHIKKWIDKNNIEIVFFNEQQNTDILYQLREYLPKIKIGTYVDYYKENTVHEFLLYDFLICNTKRHLSVFADHPQVFYIPWGTNIEIFKPQKIRESNEITFFHSVGMSTRKGTELLLNVFIKNNLSKKSKLIIHSQLDFLSQYNISKEILEENNIELHSGTVTAPGLYHLGDVYVYPTRLDGLGLTMYEALACGLPVITTNNAPMNEVINDKVGYLVDVERYYSRSDGYYWPLSEVNLDSLKDALLYYIDLYNNEDIQYYKKLAREEAINNWNWADREQDIVNIFEKVKKIDVDLNFRQLIKERNTLKKRSMYRPVMDLIPNRIETLFNYYRFPDKR